jgi:serine/threonine-protein kinase
MGRIQKCEHGTILIRCRCSKCAEKCSAWRLQSETVMQAARDVWSYKSGRDYKSVHDHESSGVRTTSPKPLGRFLLSAAIARGGMARVQLGATTTQPNEVVAVKRLLPHLACDVHYQQMFADEASTASTLRHRNIITTYGTEELEGETVLVMEYVRGLSLAEAIRLSGGRLPPRIAIAIVVAALRGLHAAHKRGIIHRDVSPQNIMIGSDGVPRIFDFGISVATNDMRRRTETRAGELKGKLAYMAPEQLGVDNQIDARVDIHAAGIILWEALVGASLFLADNEAATLARVLDCEIVAPSFIMRGIPRQLDEIVVHALAKDPSQRFQSALKMAAALESVIGICPVTSEELAHWVQGLAGEMLADQDQMCGQLLAAVKPMPRPSRPSRPPPQLTLVMDEPQTTVRSSAPSIIPPPPVSVPVPAPMPAPEAFREEVHHAPAAGDVFLVGVLILLAGVGGALLMRLADHLQFGI